MITIDTNNHSFSKSELWQERIQSFQESGMSRKDWCLQNHVSLSTLGYWLRKFRQSETATGNAGNVFEPVFAKLPSGQDFPWDANAPVPPVTIHLPENIRIEVAADCPAGLIAALLQTLRNYA